MSGRDHLGERDDADEIYLPGERFQPRPPINWRAEIITFACSAIVFALVYITGLYEVMRRYVPTWVFGLVFIGFGLVIMLRPGAVANMSRVGAILYGAVAMLFGAYVFIQFLP